MARKTKLQIERVAYAEFLQLWDSGAFENQRLGQAFYNHFRLHRLSDQSGLNALYEADGKQAMKVLVESFQMN